MDFDYQRIKDAQNLQREERICSVAPQAQKPLPKQHSVQEHLLPQNPPVLPRRSLKLPKTQNKQSLQMKWVSPGLTPGGPGSLEPQSPSLRAQTLLWFQRTQLPRLSQPGRPLPRWLHGFATRREAEDLLKDKPLGCFLLRLSESKIGFVLSYRGKDRCRHFIIEEEEGGANGRGSPYLITGEDSRHGSLQELVTHYTQNPVGPFDELLSTPCDPPPPPQCSGVCEEVSRQDVLKEGGSEKAKTKPTRGDHGDHEETNQAAPPEPLVPETETSSSKDRDVTAEYAVVRKVLKKSHSLPENQLSGLIAHSTLEASNLNVSSEDPHAVSGCGGPRGGEDSTDVPYAKVNKPPKGVSMVDTSPYVNVRAPAHQGATPPPPPSTHGSAGDPGYGQLEPMHTYEETPFIQHLEKSIRRVDFYTAGQGQGAQGSGEPQHHLYSEVNLHGQREDSSHSPLRETTPTVPSRPPPSRALHAQPQPDTSSQREPLLLSSSPSRQGCPWTPRSDGSLPSDPGISVYEQIPGRPASSRPPLPPPNPKRS